MHTKHARLYVVPVGLVGLALMSGSFRCLAIVISRKHQRPYCSSASEQAVLSETLQPLRLYLLLLTRVGLISSSRDVLGAETLIRETTTEDHALALVIFLLLPSDGCFPRSSGPCFIRPQQSYK